MEKTLTTFTIVCDWSKAIAPPAIALKRMLKTLGRTYQAKCVEARCDNDGDVVPPSLLASAVAGVRRLDPTVGVSQRGTSLFLDTNVT